MTKSFVLLMRIKIHIEKFFLYLKWKICILFKCTPTYILSQEYMCLWLAFKNPEKNIRKLIMKKNINSKWTVVLINFIILNHTPFIFYTFLLHVETPFKKYIPKNFIDSLRSGIDEVFFFWEFKHNLLLEIAKIGLV